MKTLIKMMSLMLVIALCLCACGCGANKKYNVTYKDGSVHQLTVGKIYEIHHQEPTRQNPTNPIEGAVVSGTGTVTYFSCSVDTSRTIMSTGEYFLNVYNIVIDDCVNIEFKTPIDEWCDHQGIKLQLYVGDNVRFEGRLSNIQNSNKAISLNPIDGFEIYANEDDSPVSLIG